LALSGAEGVAVDDVQNNGLLEFTALQLLFQRSGVMQGTHAAWRDGAYRQYGEVRFLLGPPVRFNYPEEAALAYYVYWSQGLTEEMYGLLGEPQTYATPPDVLAEQTQAVASVAVANLSVTDEQEASATVMLEVRMTARATQTESSAKYIWRLVKVDGQWRLAELQQP
jgi:SnoaL-like domain